MLLLVAQMGSSLLPFLSWGFRWWWVFRSNILTSAGLLFPLFTGEETKAWDLLGVPS